MRLELVVMAFVPALLLSGFDRRGFDGHAPQVMRESSKERSALQSCIVAKFARFGSPIVKDEGIRVILSFRRAQPPITVVLNDLSDETRSIEVWRTGPRDRQMWRETLACA